LKTLRSILILLLFIPCYLFGQDIIDAETDEHQEEELIEEPHDHTHDHEYDHDHTHALEPLYLEADSTKIRFWRITERTGEIIVGKPDTTLTDYFNRSTAEGVGLSVAHLGNLGTASESRLYFERADRGDFMFADHYWPYLKSLNTFNFINTKIPYSNLSYQRSGGRSVREERFQAILAVNFGKKLNVGFDIDYLYARGQYKSQQSKHMDWSLFGNYISDRHQVHLLFNPISYTNAENGGLTDDDYIIDPDKFGQKNLSPRDFDTHLQDTWNSFKGIRAYLNYRYNLGFERDTEYLSEEGDTIRQFVPVSSLIYTFDYKDCKRRFYSDNYYYLDNYYDNRNFLDAPDYQSDTTAYWSLKNTAAISLREGFSSWSKFDLTAFITHETRHYALPYLGINDSIAALGIDYLMQNIEGNEHRIIKMGNTYHNSTYVGGEIAKRQGKILRYDAQGSIGVIGHNLGDFDLKGHIETRFPIFNDTASIDVYGSVKNLSPTFYENHFQSKYFVWHNDFDKVRKVYIGGVVTIPHTLTKISLDIENVSNYIYFDQRGYPVQHSGSIQVIGVRLDQNFHYRALHCDNSLAYQLSGDKSIIPLPDFTAYSSLYFDFKVAKVLTIQAGINAYYWTKYKAPIYEPATQQFRLQDEVEIGNYPLVSGFLNCHLKQARFYIQYYNIAPYVISRPEYFSTPHYPFNPTVLRLGLSVDFIN